jgi:hypothetical protein
MSMSEGFLTYENSPAPAVPAEKASAAPGITHPPELQLSYGKTDQPAPKGAPSDQLPPAVRELREQDDARKMFSAQVTYKDAIKAADGASEQDKAAAAEWREIAADSGLSVEETRELVSVFEGMTQPPTAEVKAQWEAEAISELVREFGKEGAVDALTDAMRLVARDPRVRDFLDSTGLGSHPAYVKRLVQAARSNRRY